MLCSVGILILKHKVKVGFAESVAETDSSYAPGGALLVAQPPSGLLGLADSSAGNLSGRRCRPKVRFQGTRRRPCDAYDAEA